jgi:hypothetical protein
MIDMERLRPLGAAIILLFTGEWIGYIFSPNEPLVVQIFRIFSYLVAIIASSMAIVMYLKKIRYEHQRNVRKAPKARKNA